MILNWNLADMIRRRSLRTRAIKMLVLDEADEMLNKGKKYPLHAFLLSPPHALVCTALGILLPKGV